MPLGGSNVSCCLRDNRGLGNVCVFDCEKEKGPKRETRMRVIHGSCIECLSETFLDQIKKKNAMKTIVQTVI